MTDHFQSPGPDPYAHLRAHLAKVPEPAFKGLWCTVELQPDLFARQKFSVGIVVTDEQAVVQSACMVEDLKALSGVYPADVLQHLEHDLASAARTLKAAKRKKTHMCMVGFDTERLSTTDLWATAGESAEKIAQRLLEETVPLGRKS